MDDDYDGSSAVGWIVGIIIFIIAVGVVVAVAMSNSNAPSASAPTATDTVNKVVASTPVPQVTDSSERANVALRASTFQDPNKISYVYLISYGKVMAFYTIKGKVSSLQSYMTPTDKLVKNDGSACDGWEEAGQCYVMDAPDIDGTYGDNVDGIFFLKGDYMMSDQPLQLATPPELVEAVK